MTSLRFRPEQIELMSPARLKPYELNPRRHSEDQVARLPSSAGVGGDHRGARHPILAHLDQLVSAGAFDGCADHVRGSCQSRGAIQPAMVQMASNGVSSPSAAPRTNRRATSEGVMAEPRKVITANDSHSY